MTFVRGPRWAATQRWRVRFPLSLRRQQRRRDGLRDGLGPSLTTIMGAFAFSRFSSGGAFPSCPLRRNDDRRILIITTRHPLPHGAGQQLHS